MCIRQKNQALLLILNLFVRLKKFLVVTGRPYMNSKEIKYILDNIGKKSPQEMAHSLGLKERKVRRFIESNTRQEKDRENQPAKQLADQVSNNDSPDILNFFFFRLFAVIVISYLGIFIYSNTFRCPFYFDDLVVIVNNSLIKNIHHLHDIWSVYPSRFIIFLSIALNYYFNHLHVFGYHVFNLAVHLISAILVWWLTLLTFSAPALKDSSKAGDNIASHANLIALFVGLVFVSHPVQTEAVTYIWQRSASMVALFYLSSLCFYVKFRLQQLKNSTSGFYYILSLLIAILAMFTKENAITLPLMIMFYEFFFFRVKKKFNWGYSCPFFLTIIIIPLTISLTKSAMSQSIQGVVEGDIGISRMHYFLTQLRVMVTYIRLLFVPIHQNLDYDFPIYKNILQWPVLTSGLFLIAILYFAIRMFSKYRLVSFSIFWFFLTLLPESSFLPLKDIIFEHRLYLPLVGFSIFLVRGVHGFSLLFCHSERSEESKAS